MERRALFENEGCCSADKQKVPKNLVLRLFEKADLSRMETVLPKALIFDYIKSVDNSYELTIKCTEETHLTSSMLLKRM